jgi:hypothetical protein
VHVLNTDIEQEKYLHKLNSTKKPHPVTEMLCIEIGHMFSTWGGGGRMVFVRDELDT